ncbi:hypothetical protein NM208_g327 [Fusarium decemcellulare]|uniref:Uncharacterized protein n=1 Tax=Fusarium decemcellulare TaxID=57161 RepID=A0ACC1T069_9HYPO|nr:hypothetical protein NM208_g327 [Fusarium decemcellulare]
MERSTTSLAGLNTLLEGLSLNPMPESASNCALKRPVEIWRSYFARFLSDSGLLDCDVASIEEAISSTTETSLGDLALILPRLRLKGLDQAGLKKLAFDIGAKLPASPLFLQPWVDGIYLRMFVSPEILPRLLIPYINDRIPVYGHDSSQGIKNLKEPHRGSKRVIVEFSSPNIASDFDGNHLRSTLLGAFIANVYEAMGWEVVRLNYLGDWGKHIGLLAAGYERFGSEQKLQQGKAGHLLQVYANIEELFKPEQEAREKAKQDGKSTVDVEGKGIFAERDTFFKQMEEGDEAALGLWTRLRNITIEDLNLGYERLGINFDEFSGESQVQPATISKVEDILKEKGVLEESDGSWIIDFVKHTGKKGLGTQIIRGRDGGTRYLLRDIAAVLDRHERFDFDKMIYVVSSRQDNHFQQLFASLELMALPHLRDKLHHVNFGAIQGLEGNLLGDILDRCEARMREAISERQGCGGDVEAAESITNVAVISALLAQDMSGKRCHGYNFDSKKMTSFDFNSGPMLQICLANLTTWIAELQTDEVERAEIDYSALQDDDSADLLRIMAQLPDAILATYRSMEPHTLLSYLYKVMDSLSRVVSNPTEDEDEEESPTDQQQGRSVGERKAQLALYQNVRHVLSNGMQLLGFPVTE